MGVAQNGASRAIFTGELWSEQMKKKAPIIKKLINSVQDRLTDPSDMADPEIERRIAAVMMGEAHVGIGYEALDDVTRRQGVQFALVLARGSRF